MSSGKIPAPQQPGTTALKNKQLLFFVGVLAILAIVMAWMYWPAPVNVDDKTANDARAAAETAKAQEQNAPPLPPPPVNSTPRGAAHR
jgi:hypothetical protein